jgi:hypothetical protein
MLGSTVLETAIGLVFVYLVFSLIASALAEYISMLFDRRSDHLKHILFNLFDNDDPQGRAMLNLFVAHPMIQALNSTNWQPEFLSAEKKLEEKGQQFELAKDKWNAAAIAVTAADDARTAASKATTAAKMASTAATTVKNTTETAALKSAISAAENAILVAQATTAAANHAAETASAAADQVKAVKKWRETPTDAAERVLSARALRPAQAPAAAPAPRPVPADLTADELNRRASDVVERATKAADQATAAAAAAIKAASAAESAKKGLDNALIALVDVPRYIPDHTFIDVLLHVLTDPNTVAALASARPERATASPPASGGTISLWDRFSAAVGILSGVASRLPAGDARTKVDNAIQSVKTTIDTVRAGATSAVGVIAELEKGTNDLLAAVAAVPDDALRTALENEIHASIRPLHALGQNILMLERAGQTVSMMADSSIKTALAAFLSQSTQDLDSFKQNVGTWFNDVMDHTSGWYKRNTQRILFVIAFFLCSINNVDTVALVGHLSSNPEMRNAALKEAQTMLDAGEPARPPAAPPAVPPAGEAAKGAGGPPQPAAAPAPPPAPGAAQKKDGEPINLADKYKQALDATKLPLWWSQAEWNNLWSTIDKAKNAQRGGQAAAGSAASINYSWILAKLTGLLISILAVSMGAPFWFDVLNKLVNVRLVGRRPDPTTDVTTLLAAAQPAPPAPPAPPRP